jgi:hypothetical protein
VTWTCPRCDRPFGRANRAHVCAPGMPVELWLDELPDPQRRAAEAVLATVRRHKDLAIEAVSVGVLVKRERTIVELRPKTRWLQLSFISPAAIASERIARTIELPRGTAYFVRLRDRSDVDAELRGWLATALKGRTTTRARAAGR